MDLDITLDEIVRWKRGLMVQKAFPRLNADEREFLMTGALPGEWDEAFGEGAYE